MSFLEKFFGFFTLKTSDELRGIAAEQKRIDEQNSPENDWYRRMYDLNEVVNLVENRLVTTRDIFSNIKNIIIKLLGDDFACLMNEPVIQQAMTHVKEYSNFFINLQWNTGNNADEMAILSVEYSRITEKYRLVCASKCIAPYSNTIRGSYCSEWTKDEMHIPTWFKENLELIKEAYHDIIVETPDPLSDLNLDNIIENEVMKLEPMVNAVKICGDVVRYILHDEYQDMAYYPKIGSTSAFLDDAGSFWGIVLRWRMENDEDIKLYVFYWRRGDEIDKISVEFVSNATNRIETKYKGLTEYEAKQIIMPKWFVEKLEKVKNSTFGDNKH